MLDIKKIRLETPGCQSRIHFNNAGSSLNPRSVSVAVQSYLNREQEIGSYEAAEEAKVLINSFYTKFSELLNCDESEIAFIENSTRAWEMAVHSIGWEPGDEIITGENEYGSNYLGLLHLAKQRSLKMRAPMAQHNMYLNRIMFEYARWSSDLSRHLTPPQRP